MTHLQADTALNTDSTNLAVVTTGTNTPTEQAVYNRVATGLGEKIHQAKVMQQAPVDGRQIDPEKLFMPSNRIGLGIAQEYARMGNTPVTAALQRRATEFGVEFEHLGLTVGTVIHNVDLKQTLAPEWVQFIRETLLERKVIFFRDQNLDEDQQVAFGRRFGELDAFPFGKPGENPYVLEIIHGQASPGMENGWHTDVTWMEKPSLGSIAQCVQVPPYGGDTLFSDSHACYLGLPLAMQARLQHLRGINDYGLFLAATGPRALPAELVDEIKQQIPFGVSHPLLRTHPETGKTGLYLHGGFLRHDSLYDGRTNSPLGEAESKGILRELLQQHSRPEYSCRFKWLPGSIAFWDNRAVQHYAASDYYPHERHLRRVTVSGDVPFYDPSRQVSAS